MKIFCGNGDITPFTLRLYYWYENFVLQNNLEPLTYIVTLNDTAKYEEIRSHVFGTQFCGLVSRRNV